MPRGRPRSMVVPQPHDDKSRHVPRGLEFLQLTQENFRPLDIRIVEIEPSVMRIRNRRKRWVAHSVYLHAIGTGSLLVVRLMPVIASRKSRRNRVRPYIPRRWSIRRLPALVIVKITPLRVARRPELLRIVRSNPRRRPVMPVRAHIRVDVKIV